MGKKHQLYEIWTVGKKVRVMLSTGIKEVTEKSATFYIQDDKRNVAEKKEQLKVAQDADYADALRQIIENRKKNFSVNIECIESYSERYYNGDMEVTFGQPNFSTTIGLTVSEAVQLGTALQLFLKKFGGDFDPLENHVFDLTNEFCKR